MVESITAPPNYRILLIMAMKDLFGFIFKKSPEQKKEDTRKQSFVVPTNIDGAVTLEGIGSWGTYLDIDGTIKNEFELITRYREMALHPELDSAIDDITNEAIVIEDNKTPLKIDFPTDPVNHPRKELPQKIKNKIQEEFDNILILLDFKNQAYEIFRKWYVDGRLYYHVVIDEKNKQEGIKELRYIDPRQIKKVREIDKEVDPDTGIDLIKIKDEYYVFNQRGVQFATGLPLQNFPAGVSTGAKISKDSIVFVHSGLSDRMSSTILSYLHKAIRPLNQLKMMEDASVIYRITRAPERRIFYIDVGDMPKTKADQYMREMNQRYRNKLVYDANTGDIRDDRKYQTMVEDYWLPRRNGQTITEIETLPGGANLGEIEDIEYFLKKLYKSLNVPIGRLDPNNNMNVGRVAEISRDEVKFTKFIIRLRNRFSQLFDELLCRQLTLKGVISQEDWPAIKDYIKYLFCQDNYFAEMQQLEVIRNRISAAREADPNWQNSIYFSQEWIRKNIFFQTDDEIDAMQQQIEQEIEDGIIVRSVPLPQEVPPTEEPEKTPKNNKKTKKDKEPTKL